MTIIWGKKAYDALDAIANYLATQSPEVADKAIDRIQKTVSILSQFPNLGTKIDETGLHRLVVLDTPYVFFCRVFSEDVSIRGVFHATQRRFPE